MCIAGFQICNAPSQGRPILLACEGLFNTSRETPPSLRQEIATNNACAVVVVILKALSLSTRIEQSPSSSIQKNATGNSNNAYFKHMVYFIPMYMVQSTRRMEFRKIGMQFSGRKA
jgi:hypothetical protein